MPDVERGESSRNAMGLKEWLTVAQLLLTAFTGIFLALYFRARDEDLRRDLISLQAETERQAHLAHIDLVPICATSRSCDGTVEIRNLGPAAATNIRTVLVIESLDPAWKARIEDVGRFAVRRFPPSVTSPSPKPRPTSCPTPAPSQATTRSRSPPLPCRPAETSRFCSRWASRSLSTSIA